MTRKREVTDRVLISKLSVWTAINREQLDGKRIDDIASMMREQFKPQFISDEAIRDICNANEIRRVKNRRGPMIKTDRVRRLAKLVIKLLGEVETHIGAPCLSEADKADLAALIEGKKPK